MAMLCNYKPVSISFITLVQLIPNYLSKTTAAYHYSHLSPYLTIIKSYPLNPLASHVSTYMLQLPFLPKTRLLWKSAKVLLAARTSAGVPHCNNCTWW